MWAYMGSGCQVVRYAGPEGIVGVFSVVASWFGGVFRAEELGNAIVGLIWRISRLVQRYLERCGW